MLGLNAGGTSAVRVNSEAVAELRVRRSFVLAAVEVGVLLHGGDEGTPVMAYDEDFMAIDGGMCKANAAPKRAMEEE